MSVPVKFLKPVSRRTIEEKKLRLPSRLIRNFGNELTSEVAILGFSNGFFMRVRLSEANGKVWIDTTKLVKHFHIREGFILEFTYKVFCNFSSKYFQIEYPYDNASSTSDEEHSSSKQCPLHHDDVESGDDDSVENNGSTPDPPKGQSSRRRVTISKKNLRKSSASVGLTQQSNG
ncbi:B3 domain-containing transcription factor VRN1-like [Ricinus communis]|uniref:TF-B3 domain-containing protein n=1 Tax=Ricinus communis TaxID=3988 RepID=B9SU40_RICCO|nr:B3 domain-containing transcription factor VRN1-like [Ricinus communis]EEF32878.1 hypothetical protein RCOM_1215840 [Ricinus communis]